jgi:hypothetical protein
MQNILKNLDGKQLTTIVVGYFICKIYESIYKTHLFDDLNLKIHNLIVFVVNLISSYLKNT